MVQLLKGKIALVTGASRGIGAAVARRYAEEGAHVIALARDQKGLEALDDAVRAKGGGVTIVPQDIADGDALDRLGAVIAQRFGRLDILVGNAGILGDLGPISHLRPKVWERVMAVNVSANYRLIRSLDTLLRASLDGGRAMFVTSGVTQSASPHWGAYAVSKAALEALVMLYAAEVSHTKLCVNLIDPGEVRTQMHAEAMPGMDPMAYPLPESITDRFVELALTSCVISAQKLSV